MIKAFPITTLLIYFLSLRSLCFSQSPDDLEHKMQYAAALFETKQYGQSKEVYENILQDPLEPWQRAIVLTNLGYALLANQEWNEAINTFKAVPPTTELAPVTSNRSVQGIAITLLNQSMTTKDTSKRIELLQKSLKEFEHATSTDCALQQTIGQSTCQPNEDIENYKDFVRYQLSQLPPLPPSEGSKEIEKPDTSDNSEENKPKDENKSIDNVVRLLLEMEQEDKDTIPKTEKPLIHKESKPW